MNQNLLRPSLRFDEADWLEPLLAPFASCVAAVVPYGFAAYARIAHSDDPFSDVSVPEPGNLAHDLLQPLCSNLAEHTRTPDSCWFCLWDGHGWLNDRSTGTITFLRKDAAPQEASLPEEPEHEPLAPALLAAVRNPTRVSLPARTYVLLEGPLQAAAEFGWYFPTGHFVPQSPNIFWPEDHAWCVATEIDLPHSYVAGPQALIENLVAHPHITAKQVLPDDRY